MQLFTSAKSQLAGLREQPFRLEKDMQTLFERNLEAKGLARDVSSVGHWGNGDYEIIVHDTKNLEYIMSLVKQAI